MKVKRVLCMALVLCMLLPLVPTMPAHAATTWNYRISVYVSSDKNSEANAKTDEAILVTLKFSGGNVSDRLSGTKSKDKFIHTKNLWIESSYAPWTLQTIEFKNDTSDGFKIYSVEVDVKEGSSYVHKTPITYYPEGEKSNHSGGKWVGGKNNPNTWSLDVSSYTKRNIVEINNFDNLARVVHLNTSGNSTSLVNVNWDGIVHDQYTGGSYNSLNEAEPPTLSISAVRGSDRKGKSMTTDRLKNDYGFAVTKQGYSYTPSKIANKMLSDGVPNLEVDVKVQFPSTSTGVLDETITVQFIMDIVEIESITMKNYHFTDSYGNKYYKSTKGAKEDYASEWEYLAANDGSVVIDIKLKTSGNYSHLGNNWLNGKRIEFDEIYLRSKDQNGNEIELQPSLWQFYDSKEQIYKKHCYISGDGNMSLSFNYNGTDTGDNGLYLIMKGAKLTNTGSNDYTLWEPNTTDRTIDNSTGKITISKYKPDYKIDAKGATNLIKAHEGYNLNSYEKYQKVDITLNEDVNSSFGNNTVKMTLSKNILGVKVPLSFYEFDYDPTSTDSSKSWSTGLEQKLPIRANSTVTATIALKDQDEGEYYLELDGTDKAGNGMAEGWNSTTQTQNFKGCYMKLDSLAPRVSVVQNLGEKGVDGSRTNTYDVTLTELSHTGHLYYMFTEKSFEEAKKVPLGGSTGEGEASVGNEYMSLFGKWLDVEARDMTMVSQTERKTTLPLTVPDGKAFVGRLVYYAVDSAGNVSDFGQFSGISIDNESTENTITPTYVDPPQKSYKISIESKDNSIAYRWFGYETDSATGKQHKKYLTDDYKTYTGTIDTSKDAETKDLNGQYVLEAKITTPHGSSVTREEKYFFDNQGPDITFTLPPETSYQASQSISIMLDDKAGLNYGSPKIQFVAPDGSKLNADDEPTDLLVRSDVMSTTVNIANMASGAYAVNVTAKDINGNSSSALSKPIYIRSAAPTGTVAISTPRTYSEKPLITKDESVKLSFDITENFKNASATVGKQLLYYRVATSEGDYGEWIKAGTMNNIGNAFSYKGDVTLPKLSFTEGLNELYVQTAVCHESADTSTLTNAHKSELEFYYDETAPTTTMIIEDYHTASPITGRIIASDDYSTSLSATCADSNVQIGEFANGEFAITVTKNVDTTIFVSDTANNKSEIKLVISGIDTEGPSAQIAVDTKMVGKRQDATATVTISDMVETLTTVNGSDFTNESFSFALIPADSYTGGAIPEQYYAANLSENIHFSVTKMYSQSARWDDEYTNTYKIDVAGVSGEWYLGVHVKDALGNLTDKVFNAEGEKLVTIDKNITDDKSFAVTKTIKPPKPEQKAVVTATFDVPVCVLPQSSISATEDNYELLYTYAEQYALNYSTTISFTIDKANAYRDYYLYAMDDLGRANCFTLTITEDDVTFDSSSPIKATVATASYDASGNKTYTPIGDDEKICAASYDQYYLVVEPATTENENTWLLPEQELKDAYYDQTYNYTNGFKFSYTESSQYSKDKAGNKVVSWNDPKSVCGYTKLIYTVERVLLEDGGYYDPVEITDRPITVRTFHKNNVNAETGAVDESAIAYKSAVISCIDNTAPIVTWSFSPNVTAFEKTGEFSDDGLPLYDWIKRPTPQNVTFTLNAQDKESGIDQIVALMYYEPGATADEPSKLCTITPDMKEVRANDGYWSWDGRGKSIIVTKRGEDYETYEEVTTLPLIIEYLDSNVDDIYSVKTLKYTFTDEFNLGKMTGISMGEFYNTLGAEGMWFANSTEGGVTTEGLMYKMPIEEGKDYSIKYYRENGDEIPDISAVYYNNVNAVIELLERGVSRGLYVANNNGSLTKGLSIYQNTFDFKLKDKYGYDATASVRIDNFDTTPGTIDYTLSTTAKTNQPIELYVVAEDTESGINTVSVTGAANVALTEVDDGIYYGIISQNGTYSITMYDNSGNKTVKNFVIKNYNDVLPTATITYSVGDKSWADGETPDFYTSRPVTANISFSKDNVKIIGVEPLGLTSADYTIDYSTTTATFTKSGNIGIYFEDDYGNQGSEVMTVGNIDKTPPTVEAVYTTEDLKSVSVTFNKLTDAASAMDRQRLATEIFATYGGVTKSIENEDGTKNGFTFTQNGNYTVKIHDKEGLTSSLDISVTGIDKSAPKVTSVKCSYYYDVYDEENKVWQTLYSTKTIIPSEGAVGYRFASDDNNITNQDVTVNITTDSDTRILGGTDDYSTTKERIYGQNSFFAFNLEKKNGLVTSYGVDIGFIDKTPPVINLFDKGTMMFYENPEMGQQYDKELLVYEAYDVVNGKKVPIDKDRIEVESDNFDMDNIDNNDFDSGKLYTITYRVSDDAHNITEVKRTIRLIGMNDTIAMINGELSDFTGTSMVSGDTVSLTLKNFSGTAYVRYAEGVKTMAQMKKAGTIIEAVNGEYKVTELAEGWYTFYVQTDKRDYFTLCVYVSD